MSHLTQQSKDIQKQSILLSVILPIRNEEKILWNVGKALAEHFDRIVGAGNWQYVLCENGSSDGTQQIIKQIIEHWPTSKALKLKKADYGNALREGILASEGKWNLIMNVDHLWDPPYFEWAWKHREEYDLIIGSKRADPTLNRQDQYRRILSAGLNSLLQYLFDCAAAETHGMKLIRTETLRPVARLCQMRRGQFDTELTLRALRGGFWVAEVPMPYIEKRNSKNFMIKKIGQNIWDLHRFYKVMKDVPYEGNIKYRRFCREDLLPKDQYCQVGQ
jgi:glycosyltransferase involved in cell wall biosynthesis